MQGFSAMGTCCCAKVLRPGKAPPAGVAIGTNGALRRQSPKP